MLRDLREIVKSSTMESEKLSKNHRAKFQKKLKKELHASENSNFGFLKIAASIAIILGLVSSLFYFTNTAKNTIADVKPSYKFESLGSVSPELKNIENYYLASIQTEIANLEETSENKELLDGYLEKIGELTSDYKLLTKELNEEGLNEKTINALIENLQLRLKLLYQLKEQLNELQKINNTENESIQV